MNAPACSPPCSYFHSYSSRPAKYGTKRFLGGTVLLLSLLVLGSWAFAQNTPGARSRPLTFSDNAANSLPTVGLAETLSSPVTVSPARLTLASGTVGTKSGAQTVTLTNHLNTSLPVSTVVATGDFVVASNTCGASVGPRRSCTVGVTFTPTGVGVRTGTLTLPYRASGSPSVIPLSGAGNADGLISLVVTPANPSIPLGEGQQFTATGYFRSGSTQNLTTSVAWGSSAPGVATITAAGLASSISLGSTTIVAVWVTITPLGRATRVTPGLPIINSPPSNISGSTTLTVTAAAAPTNLTVLNLEGSDLIWNPSQQKLYVAVPSAASVNAGTITVVDPIAGSIISAQQLSSAPSGLAVSDDSQYLYAVISGASAIQRLTLPALTPDIEWSLGKDPIFGGTALAGDIKVQPGAPHTLAVSMGEYGSGSVAVFDDAVERSAVAGSISNEVGNSLQWKPDGSELYAAYTMLNDSGYWTSVSDDALYTMPVTETGVGAVTTYHSTFRSEGAHLHSDSTTGYVYGDWGEVINAANGIPVGNYRWSRPNGTYFPGPLSVVDPRLNRFYTLLEVLEPDETLAFQIQAFDQTQFRLLSTIVISNPAGEPTNFIRWGQAGLAFVTNATYGSTSGNLYVLDGGFVNPLGVQDTSVGTPLNPVPTLTAVSPITAVAGSGGVTLTVTGRDFIGQPTVYWNGNALPTTMVNSTELWAQVPASDLTSASQATITASNTSAAFPASNSMPFSVDSPPPTGNQISVYSTGGNDLVWDANAAKIYVSMPGIQGDSGDAIAIVDPVAGTVTNSGFLGSDPARLSLSENGQYLYMALYGENAIQQLVLSNFTVNTAWNLGGAGTFSGPYYALDLQAAPGAPQTTAVELANFAISPSAAGVVIYDGSTPRPNIGCCGSSLQWAGDDSTLYGVDQEVPQDFFVVGVGPSGAALSQQYDRVFNSYSASIHYDAGTGLVYTDDGQAFQPSNGTIVGSYGASGIAVPDSTLDRVFILGQTAAQAGTLNYTIESFDQAKFTAIASIPIDNVVGAPTALIRWGSHGLAFTTRIGAPTDFTGSGPGQLYVISGDFVQPSGSASPTPGTARLLPVQRTWSLASSSRPQSQPAVVHPNPLNQ